MEKPIVAPPYPADVGYQCLDYMLASQWVDHVLGFEQRDAHDKFPEQGAYLDYWHYVLDELFSTDNVRNDSYVTDGPYSFAEFATEVGGKYSPEDWRVIVARAWAEEFPGVYQIWMSW